MSYLIFLIMNLFLYLFKIFEHKNRLYFIELEIYGILIVLKIVKFLKFAVFRNSTIPEI